MVIPFTGRLLCCSWENSVVALDTARYWNIFPMSRDRLPYGATFISPKNLKTKHYPAAATLIYSQANSVTWKTISFVPKTTISPSGNIEAIIGIWNPRIFHTSSICKTWQHRGRQRRSLHEGRRIFPITPNNAAFNPRGQSAMFTVFWSDSAPSAIGLWTAIDRYRISTTQPTSQVICWNPALFSLDIYIPGLQFAL